MDDFSRAVIKSIPMMCQFNRSELVQELNQRNYAALPDEVKKLFPELTEWMPKEEKRAIVPVSADKTTFQKLMKAGLPVKEAA